MTSKILPLSIIVLALCLALPSFAQEDFPNLQNLNFETAWANGAQIPGWDFRPWVVTGGTGDPRQVADGNDNIFFGGVGNHNLKFEIAAIDTRTCLVFKEVNWGVVNEVTFTVDLAHNNWGGPAGSVLGLGIDPNGGATSWADTTVRATITSPASQDITVYTVSTGPIQKPVGATTFTVVLYCFRIQHYYNGHIDNVVVDTDFVFTNPPSNPSANSSTHGEGFWSRNANPSFSFSTVNANEFSYVLDNSPTTVPDTAAEGTDPFVTYTGLDNNDVTGDYYFHVRAGNAYGWSNADHFGPILIDAATPVVQDVTWALSSGGGVDVSASVTDAGGSPFGQSSIELLGDQLVANGGAETASYADWVVTGNAAGLTSSFFGPGGPYEGSEYFSFTISGLTINATMVQEVPVQADQLYRLTTRASVGASENETTRIELRWIDGPAGGASSQLGALQITDGQTGGWTRIGDLIIPSGDTVTIVIRITTQAGGGTDYAGAHLDDISLRWYPGEPHEYTGGVASWNRIAGINGTTPLVRATDGAGNRAEASSPTPISGASGLTSVDRVWNMYR